MELKKETKFESFINRAYLKHDLKDPLSLVFDIFYMILITTAVVFSIMRLAGINLIVINIIEGVIVFFFFIEYIIRFSTAEKVYWEPTILYSKVRFLTNYESIIDVFCFIFFIVILALQDEPNVYYLAIVLLLRVFKLIKYPRHYFKKKENK